MFVREGKCVHAGQSQDLINSWNCSVHLTQTDPCMHHKCWMRVVASSKADFFQGKKKNPCVQKAQASNHRLAAFIQIIFPLTLPC